MESRTIKVCPLAEVDLQEFSDLFDTYLREFSITHPRADLQRFVKKILELSWVDGLFVQYGGQVAGFCLWTRNYSQIKLSEALLVEDIFVLPGLRRRGIGSRLLSGIVEHAREISAEAVFGLVLPNEREYFLKAGYEVTEHRLLVRNIDKKPSNPTTPDAPSSPLRGRSGR